MSIVAVSYCVIKPSYFFMLSLSEKVSIANLEMTPLVGLNGGTALYI